MIKRSAFRYVNWDSGLKFIRFFQARRCLAEQTEAKQSRNASFLFIFLADKISEMKQARVCFLVWPSASFLIFSIPRGSTHEKTKWRRSVSPHRVLCTWFRRRGRRWGDSKIKQTALRQNHHPSRNPDPPTDNKTSFFFPPWALVCVCVCCILSRRVLNTHKLSALLPIFSFSSASPLRNAHVCLRTHETSWPCWLLWLSVHRLFIWCFVLSCFVCVLEELAMNGRSDFLFLIVAAQSGERLRR